MFDPMCGRFKVELNGEQFWKFAKTVFRKTPWGTFKELEWVIQKVDYPKKQVFPTDSVAVFHPSLNPGTQTACSPMHWGILPPWGLKRMEWRQRRDGAVSFRWKGRPAASINSRATTLRDTNGWKNLLATRRCAIPATGFLEWQDDELRDKSTRKKCREFYLKQAAPFCFAGVWSEVVHEPTGQPFYSCSVITTEPNQMLLDLPHHRMPAILKPEELEDWLSPDTPSEAAFQMLHSTEDEKMDSAEV